MTASGDDILRKLIETYSSLNTYQHTSVEIHGNDKSSQRVYFKSPDKLRIEYSDIYIGGTERKIDDYLSGTSLVIRDGSKYLVKLFHEDTIRVTKREALKRSNLLKEIAFRKINSSWIADITNPKLSNDTIIDGITCFTIDGNLHREGDIEVAIEKKSLLVRRIRLKEWFEMMQKKNIDDGVPDLSSMPFSREIIYNCSIPVPCFFLASSR